MSNEWSDQPSIWDSFRDWLQQVIIDPHIVRVGLAQLLQPLLDCREAYLVVLIVCGQAREHADAPHLLRPLRARRERPRHRAAEKGDEFPSPHICTQAQGKFMLASGWIVSSSPAMTGSKSGKEIACELRERVVARPH